MTIWLKLLDPLVKILGPILKYAGIYLAGQRAGSLKAANKSLKKLEKHRKKADEIEMEIATSSDKSIRDFLRDNATRK